MENSTQNISDTSSHQIYNATTEIAQLKYISLGILFFSIEVIIILPVIFGNFLILFSIVSFRRLRTRINILIANLAMSDFLVGAVMIPYDLVFLFDTSLRQHKVTCLLRHAFEIAFLGSSVMNLLAISIERYIAILHPLSHVKCSTSKFLASLIATSWILSILVAFLPLFGWNSWYQGAMCDAAIIHTKSYSGIVYLLLIGSLIANFIMYIQVVKTAFDQLKAIQSETSIVPNDTLRHVNSKKKNIKKTKIMILVLGVFAICWGPYCMTVVFESLFLEPSADLELVKKFLSCFGILNSGLNWIIFGLKNSSFRNAFKYILCCGKGMDDSSLHITSSK